MQQQKADFKTAFLALTAEESPSDHPTVEALAAYHDGRLSSEERASVHRHLAECRECSELARDLDLFTEAPMRAEEGDEFEVATFLRALKPQLASEPARTVAWSPLAVAASLIVAVAASWWLARDLARQQIGFELSQPRANVSILDLVEDRSERTGNPPRTVEMTEAAGAVLVLTPDSPGDFPTYEVKILDSGDAPISTIENLEKDSYDETFTLLIPPGGLPAGDYRVELHGLTDEGSSVIAGYRIRVVGSPEAPP